MVSWNPDSSVAEGCADPDVGRLLEPFVLGKLSVAERQRFERHLAGCLACAEEVRFRQDLVRALVEERRRHRWRVALAAASFSLAALVVAIPVLRRTGHPRVPPVATVELLPVVRGAQEPKVVRASAPLHLRLRMPIPEGGAPVSYRVTIGRPGHPPVAALAGLRPAGPDLLSVDLPKGIAEPGTYVVRVEPESEQTGEEASFVLEVTGRGR